MTKRGAIVRGLAAVNAVRDEGSARLALEDVTEEALADAIADVLHLAQHLHLLGEMNADVEDILAKGRSYFAGDLAEPWS
jgi:hypothetical protein